MNILVRSEQVEPVGVQVTADILTVELADGRIVSAPTEWFARLTHGTHQEWANLQLMYDGVHWPDLNEDISIEGLFSGEKSGGSPEVIKRWLDLRSRGAREAIPELPISHSIMRELEKMGVMKPKSANRNRRVVGMARGK